MGFRFRKSVTMLPGVRLNFSNGGVSTSVGGFGNTLNFSRRGVRHTASIAGTGMSYSSMVGGRRRRRRVVGNDNFHAEADAVLVENDAKMAVLEAHYRQAELAISEAEKIEHEFTPQQKAELDVHRAELRQHAVLLAKNRRESEALIRDVKNFQRELDREKQKRVLKWVIIAAVILMIIFGGGAKANAGETFRNAQGHIVGSSNTAATGVTTFRNSAGHITGTASTAKTGVTTFRDAQGHQSGTAERRR